MSVARASASRTEVKASLSKAILAKAELAARLNKVDCRSDYRVCNRPYEAILEASDEFDCDLIFMASHGRHGLNRIMIGSQTMKVLAQARIPVLVDTSETNSDMPSMGKALATIQDEHRTLGVLLTEMLYLVREIREGRIEPDYQLLQAIVFYAREFPLRLHHPKEEAFLFSALKRNHPDSVPVLAELERQHREEPSLVSEIESAIDNYEKTGAAGFERFATCVDKYVAFVWQHLTLEEREVLPAARQYLKEKEWEGIAQAFGENGDPRFDPMHGEEFRELISRIKARVPSEKQGVDWND